MSVVGWAAIVVAGYFVLCIFVPAIRTHWKGTDVRVGAIGNAGAAIFFACFGSVLALPGHVDPGLLRLLPWAAVVGALIGLGGKALDKRFRASRFASAEREEEHE